MIPCRLSPSLAVKLASIAVHADEACSTRAHPFDRLALRALLDDPEVATWLDCFDAALLPLPRPT